MYVKSAVGKLKSSASRNCGKMSQKQEKKLRQEKLIDSERIFMDSVEKSLKDAILRNQLKFSMGVS